MLEQSLQLLETLLLPLLLGLAGVAALLVAAALLAGRTRPPAHAARPDPARAAPAARPRAAPPEALAPATPAAPAAPAAAVPAVPDAVPTVPAWPARNPAAACPRPPLVGNLLLVDDSAVVRAKLRRLFEPAGYRCTLARDGQEALDLLQQGRHGLLVTDLEMPRLDGMGLIRAVLQLPGCAGMPILAITGHDDLQAQLNQLHAVAGIYHKPWLDDELLAHVQALLPPPHTAPLDEPAEHAEPA